MPGSVTEVKITVGEKVKVNQLCLCTEAEDGDNDSSTIQWNYKTSNGCKMAMRLQQGTYLLKLKKQIKIKIHFKNKLINRFHIEF